ncbi:spore cortex-lytic enzyme [Lasius niger]|uniref:Spore cortex-lytic enzyme n=1 Tax=Lasius niger TaxID=67767 RepID=A0A0J7JXT0_LASNI|nr:spore cortex-lytic enzyme [Lasius niger]
MCLRPAIGIAAIGPVIAEQGGSETAQRFGVTLGISAPRYPHIEGGAAPAAHLGRVDEHAAIAFQHAQRGRPYIGAIDVAALPGGGDVAWIEIDQSHLCKGDAPVLQGFQQAVMGGATERRGDDASDQLLRAVEGRAHHQRFASIGARGDKEHHQRQLARQGSRQRHRTDVANLDAICG